MKIKHIPPAPAPAGKTLGAAAGFVGLVIGVVRSLAYLAFEMGRQRGYYYRRSTFDELVDGPMAFLFIPLFAFGVAFLIGFILAVMYNTAAGMTGGIQLDVDAEDDFGKKGKEFDW